MGDGTFSAYAARSRILANVDGVAHTVHAPLGGSRIPPGPTMVRVQSSSGCGRDDRDALGSHPTVVLSLRLGAPRWVIPSQQARTLVAFESGGERRGPYQHPAAAASAGFFARPGGCGTRSRGPDDSRAPDEKAGALCGVRVVARALAHSFARAYLVGRFQMVVAHASMTPIICSR